MSTYEVQVAREGTNWVAHWGGRSTFASSLRALDRAVREVIVLAEDLDDAAANGLDVNFTYDLDSLDGFGDGVAAAERARHDAEVAAATYARRLGVAVLDLRTAGLSHRDIAAIVGLSHQRVAQVEAARRAEIEDNLY